jgi:hypothetical protein
VVGFMVTCVIWGMSARIKSNAYIDESHE